MIIKKNRIANIANAACFQIGYRTPEWNQARQHRYSGVENELSTLHIYAICVNLYMQVDLSLMIDDQPLSDMMSNQGNYL